MLTTSPYARTMLSLSVAVSFTCGTITGTAASLMAQHPASFTLATVPPVIECDTDADCEAKNPSIEREHADAPNDEQRVARGIRTFRF